MADELVVSFDGDDSEIKVIIEDNSSDPDLELTLSEVALAGPAGPVGPRGPTGLDAALELDSHINNATPHPVYDSGVSFLLLYQNAKV